MLYTFNLHDTKNLKYPPKMLALKKLQVYISKLEKKQNKRLSHCILLVFPEKRLSICEHVCVSLCVCACVCVY